MKELSLLLGVAAAALTLVSPSSATRPPAVQEESSKASKAESKAEEDDGKLTLEKLFHKEPFFGRSPRSMAISADGKVGAFLWRPHVERRHGGDLFLLDLESDALTRATSVSVMSEFQASAKKVADDRIKKAKEARKEGAKDAEKETSWSDLKDKVKGDGSAPKDEETEEEIDERDLVTEKDADDKKAPRYGGVGSFTWSPVAQELLFTSGGDVYRLRLDQPADSDDRLARLTKTREVEREVQYLPDGSGYTTLLDGALVRVRFGDHFVDQLDPELPDGMRMRDYEVSPDGAKVAFIASAGQRSPGKRTVDIATYRKRFMEVRTVPRTVSDDPIDRTTTAIFLYELPGLETEDGKLAKVFEQKTTGPRDILRVPDWAPDSSRVCFSVFDQETSQVRVLEAKLPEAPKPAQADGKTPEDDEKDAAEKNRTQESADEDEEEEEPETKKAEELKIEEARIVHRFLHNGGPTTPRMIEPRYLADSRRIVLLTELTGFRQLHILNPVYESLEPLTQGHFEVYPLEMPKDRSCIFVEATKEDPACLDLYRVDLETREMTRLSSKRGRYLMAAFSPDGSHALANYTAFGTSGDLVHLHASEGEEKRITDSHPEKAKELLEVSPEFFVYENRTGQEIHGFLMEPKKAGKAVKASAKGAEDEKRPLLLYVYGGPLGTRKQVTEGNYGGPSRFAHYMTETHGYVTATIDPRGMSGYGALYEKSNFEQVGKPQVDDLVDGVKYLIEHHGVDPERVAIHGWSFGGFQTQMCLYTEPDVFKCGIAGAGPTEWENYNSWYSTGTIGGSREGETDLEKYSLLPLAKNLEGKLLLVHGMEDANVLYQDTVRVYAELLEAGKETLVELSWTPREATGSGAT